MNLPALVFVVVVAAVAVIGGVSQIIAYRREGSVLSSAQLALRLTMAVLLLAVLALSVWGLPRLAALGPGTPPVERVAAARTAAAFMTLVVLLAVALMVLAVVDLRHLRAAQHRARAGMYRNLAQLQEELRARSAAPDASPPPPPAESPPPSKE